MELNIFASKEHIIEWRMFCTDQKLKVNNYMLTVLKTVGNSINLSPWIASIRLCEKWTA